MKREEGMKLVCKLIHLVNSTPIADINESDRLIDDLNMDSVELIDFFINLEEYNIFLKKEQINRGLTVGDIVSMMNID
ncbi:TPA: acyl carrier protein [Salmonella enterica]|nr:acyl carrier protein [Salmonella enterica]EDR9399116.1 acyl carrier protein [Salmonella enterica subsp. enterica]EDT6893121.1 acyl carrier protein [Salmonella enterica subsp. enterica serovar Javiana]EDX5193485.1 acyl carrier protein [Salmonella enterica subsp. enterica serovar Glostrup]EHW1129031.1 acyl carrier protein [Salmonella enterica subsp. enterica serovar Kinondoni]HCM6292667.1 acyl carrier protein [Salmonella enterica subsp. enterica serovar 16:l,v:-]